MNNLIYFYGSLFLGAIFAFLKMFFPYQSIYTFTFYGIVFSIAEFIVRVPTIYLANGLNYSVLSLQIIWISLNFILSAILSSFIYKELIVPRKIIGMFIILIGIYVATK